MFQLRRPFSVLISKLLLFLSFIHYGSSDKFLSYSTSVVTMTKLLNIELSLITAVVDALLELETDIDVVRSYINSVIEEHEKSYEDPETYLSNPLNSFTLLRRTYEDWPTILEYLGKSIKEDIENQLKDKEMYLPVTEDMSEAALSMDVIRRTYKLLETDIADGQLNGVKYDGKLSCVDLYAIGLGLFELKKYSDAAVWLNASLHTDYQGPTPKEISNCDQETIRTLYLDSLVREDEIPELDYDKDSFEACCRGEDLRLKTNNLFCRYNSSSNYFHILAPSKMEELSKDPFIVIFHDVLTNDEINYIRNINSEFKRATVHVSLNDSKYSDERTVQDAIIDLEDSTIKKIISITGLNPGGFETMGVLNYGLGGQYTSHHDFFYPEEEEYMNTHGDRIATMLFYLNEVEQGGATVFPEIGLSVKPEKGALLLWYNLKNSGESDNNTLHGSCPVILGSKWAATIWVRENAQFRTMPCFDP